MNKTDLIDELTVRLGDRRTASAAVEGVVDVITRAVAKGEKVGISGFGVFEKADRAARTARNPTTGEAVKLKKTSVPKFRPGQGFKDIVSGAKKVPPPSKTPGRAVTARAGTAAAKAVQAPAKAAATAVGTAVKAPGRAVAKTVGAVAESGRSATRPSARAAAPTRAAAPARAAAAAPGRTVSAKAPATKAAAGKSAGSAGKSPVKAAKAPTRAATSPAKAAKSPTRSATSPAKTAAPAKAARR